MEIPVPVEVAADLIEDTELALKAHDKLIECEVIDTPDSETFYVRRLLEGNLVVSNREICAFQHKMKLQVYFLNLH